MYFIECLLFEVYLKDILNPKSESFLKVLELHVK